MQDGNSDAHSAEGNVEISVEDLNLGRLSHIKGQTQAVWLGVHGEVWHFCLFSKSFTDELLWEEGVACGHSSLFPLERTPSSVK